MVSLRRPSDALSPPLRRRSPSQPAVVFVHGLMGYSFSWRHNLEFFARQREVCAVDLLGMGHSDRPEADAADFGLEAAASRLLRLLHSLGCSQIDLVATSHGGAVAMLAASKDRSSPRPMIRRLVLIAPAHPFMSETHVQLALFLLRSAGCFCNGLASYGAAVQGQAMGVMYSDESRITPETRAGYAVNLRRCALLRVRAGSDAELAGRHAAAARRRCPPSPPFPCSCSGAPTMRPSPPARVWSCAMLFSRGVRGAAAALAICPTRKRPRSLTAASCSSWGADPFVT